MPHRFALGSLTLVALTTWFLALLFRGWGIHIDEVGYLFLSQLSPLGDSLASGKPFFFYAMNFLFHQALSWHSSTVVLGVFGIYALINALAIAQLTLKLPHSISKTESFFLLILSPVIFLNASQFMMETFGIGLFIFIFLEILKVRESHQSFSNLRILLLGVLLILLKETYLFPIFLILIFTGFRVSPFQTGSKIRGTFIALPLGAGLGYVLNRISLSLVHAKTHFYTPGLSTGDFLFTLETNFESNFDLILGNLFLIAPLSIIGLLHPTTRRSTCVVFGLSSLALIGVFTLANIHAARYGYPIATWATLELWMILLPFWSKVKSVILGLVFLALSVTLLLPERISDPFWPDSIENELKRNGFTTQYGRFSWLWLLSENRMNQSPCILSSRENQEKNWALAKLLYTFTNQLQWLDGPQAQAQFENCPTPKLAFLRFLRPEKDKSNCPELLLRYCSGSTTQFCVDQPVLVFSDRAPAAVDNLFCTWEKP